MKIPLVLALIFVGRLFGLSPVSQLYVTAKHAQAAIEASRTAPITGLGNLVTILITAVIVVVVLVLVIFMAYLEFKGIPYRRTFRSVQSHPSFQHLEEDDHLLPTLMTMMMYEILRQQETQHHMMDMSYPEIPTASDQNDFWGM